MVTSIDRYDKVDVFVGLDVGKGEHHAVALDRAGRRLFNRALSNDECKLRAVLASHILTGAYWAVLHAGS